MCSRSIQEILVLVVIATGLSQGCSDGKLASTDDERLAELLRYFRENGFPLEKRHAQWSSSYAIEQSSGGSFAHTGFVVFPPDSDDGKNIAELKDRNPASIYNTRCKIAMFWPSVTGPPNTPDDWTPAVQLTRHAEEDSAFVSLFQKFKPK